ncbi:MAG: LytTR family DNA-binding domain-containing protein [Bacteroidia bacterium]
MTTALIIDDEQHCREMLKNMLASVASEDIKLLAECKNAEEGISAIAELHPQLVFLDVEMPGMNGIEMLQKISPFNFDVIFTTAHEMYAVKAIKLSALDYLLKPIGVYDLKNALEKYKSKSKISDTAAQMSVLLQNIKNLVSPLNKIAIPVADGLTFVAINEIVRIESDSNYSQFFLLNGTKHLVAKTLKEYEDLLTDHHFIRIHKSHLVNHEHIKKFVSTDGGYVVMSDGSSITVASRKRHEVIGKLSA